MGALMRVRFWLRMAWSCRVRNVHHWLPSFEATWGDRGLALLAGYWCCWCGKCRDLAEAEQ